MFVCITWSVCVCVFMCDSMLSVTMYSSPSYSCFRATLWTTCLSRQSLYQKCQIYPYIRGNKCVSNKNNFCYSWIINLFIPIFLAPDLRLSLAIFPKEVFQTAVTSESELALEMEPLCQRFYRHDLLFTQRVILRAVSTWFMGSDLHIVLVLGIFISVTY